MAASPSEPSTGVARARDTGAPTAPGQRPRQPRPLLAPHAKRNSWYGMVPTQASGRVALDFGRGRWLEGRAAAGQRCRRWDPSGPCSDLGGGDGPPRLPWALEGTGSSQGRRGRVLLPTCRSSAWAGLLWPSLGLPIWETGTIPPPVSVLGKFCHLLIVHYLPLSVHLKENHGAKGSPSGLEGEGLPRVQQASSCPWACKHLGQAPPSPGRPSPQASAAPPPPLLAGLPGQREAAEGCPLGGQTSRLEGGGWAGGGGSPEELCAGSRKRGIVNTNSTSLTRDPGGGSGRPGPQGLCEVPRGPTRGGEQAEHSTGVRSEKRYDCRRTQPSGGRPRQLGEQGSFQNDSDNWNYTSKILFLQ